MNCFPGDLSEHQVIVTGAAASCFAAVERLRWMCDGCAVKQEIRPVLIEATAKKLKTIGNRTDLYNLIECLFIKIIKQD
jgi:hypothetical protein